MGLPRTASFQVDSARIGGVTQELQGRALRAIAVFEIAKGVAALSAGIGILGFAHRDLVRVAHALLGHLHLDPEARFPQLIVDYAGLIGNADLRGLLMLAAVYALIRFVEGYGLWRQRYWAEWLAALSGAVYLPLEANHLLGHATALNGVVLLGNLCVVAYMVCRLCVHRVQG